MPRGRRRNGEEGDQRVAHFRTVLHTPRFESNKFQQNTQRHYLGTVYAPFRSHPLPLRFSLYGVGERVRAPSGLVALPLLFRSFPLMTASSPPLEHSLNILLVLIFSLLYSKEIGISYGGHKASLLCLLFSLSNMICCS